MEKQDLDLKTCGSLCAGSGAFVHHAANGNMGKIIYAFVTYNIMNTVVYTAISQPFHALGSLMSRDRRERDVICNIRMVLSITASMIITAFTLPLINIVANITGNQQMAWILVTAGYAIILSAYL